MAATTLPLTVTGLLTPAVIGPDAGTLEACQQLVVLCHRRRAVGREPRIEALSVFRRGAGQVGEAGAEDGCAAQHANGQDGAQNRRTHGDGVAPSSALERVAHADQRRRRRARSGQQRNGTRGTLDVGPVVPREQPRPPWPPATTPTRRRRRRRWRRPPGAGAHRSRSPGWGRPVSPRRRERRLTAQRPRRRPRPPLRRR